jgi:hypothetical protein
MGTDARTPAHFRDSAGGDANAVGIVSIERGKLIAKLPTVVLRLNRLTPQALWLLL